MSELAQNLTRAVEGGVFNDLPAQADEIFEGALASIDSDGYPGHLALGEPFVGIVDEHVDNSAGSAGDKTVRIRHGVFRIVMALTGVGIDSVERAVYASDSNTITFAAFGATTGNTPVGKVARYISSGLALIEFSTLAPALGVPALVEFTDDFLGAQVDISESGSTGAWASVIVGSATAATDDDVHGGAVELIIEATDEAQDADLYANDNLQWDIDNLHTFRARFKAITPGTGVRAVIGMAAAHNLDKDAIVANAWFSLDASLDLKAETDDGTNDNDDKTVATIVTDTFYEVEIDFRDLEDVKFYLNGAAVATATTFDMSNYSGNLQIYIGLDKASGAVTGSLIVDLVQVVASRG